MGIVNVCVYAGGEAGVKRYMCVHVIDFIV